MKRIRSVDLIQINKDQTTIFYYVSVHEFYSKNPLVLQALGGFLFC